MSAASANTAYNAARELGLEPSVGQGYVSWDDLVDLAYLAYWQNRIVQQPPVDVSAA